MFFVGGDEELSSFCVEYGSDVLWSRIIFFNAVGRVCGDDVHGVYGDDFCGVCEVEDFCDGDGDSESGEAARPYGEIDVLDLFWVAVEAFAEGSYGCEYFGAVSHWRRECKLVEYFRSVGDSDGAIAA